jgi:hypothetical protein
MIRYDTEVQTNKTNGTDKQAFPVHTLASRLPTRAPRRHTLAPRLPARDRTRAPRHHSLAPRLPTRDRTFTLSHLALSRCDNCHVELLFGEVGIVLAHALLVHMRRRVSFSTRRRP